LGAPFPLLKEVERINTNQRARFVHKIKDTLWILKNKRIAVWGLTFKPDTDDVRCSVAVEVVNDLLREGAMVYAYDPRGMDNVEELGLCKGLNLVKSPLEAVREAEALILATEWKEFHRVDLEETRRVMQTPIVFDGRNFFDPQTMKAVGFQYYGIGR